MKKNTLLLRLIILALCLVLVKASVVHAEPPVQYIDGNYGFYSPDFEACSSSDSGPATTTVDTGAAEADNAKIVIGIAKADKLDKRAGLIGLMVAIAESHLKIYANKNVPLSLDNPSKQATGSDHDSLGVFQQRISTNWSTISTDKNNKDAVYQLMDPAYNAEAFFGSPPGSKAPAQLSKGLQNHSGWESMDPWVAAQAVQASGTPDGSNYKTKMAQAQSLIDQYWDSSPEVPLPVAFTAAAAPPTDSTTIAGGCSGNITVSGSLFETIVKYAWPDYHKAPYLVMKPEYEAAINAARARKEYVGGGSHPGVDCGGFVTRVMRDSGADPSYNAYQGTTDEQEKYMHDHPEKYQLLSGVKGTADLQPGDIAVNSTHTYIYVGTIQGFNGNSASASFSTSGDSWRTPMASPAYGFGDYRWFRLKGGA